MGYSQDVSDLLSLIIGIPIIVVIFVVIASFVLVVWGYILLILIAIFLWFKEWYKTH